MWTLPVWPGGAGTTSRVPARRVLPGVRLFARAKSATDTPGTAAAALSGEAGFEVTSSVVPDNSLASVAQVARAIESTAPDYVVAVGGGRRLIL